MIYTQNKPEAQKYPIYRLPPSWRKLETSLLCPEFIECVKAHLVYAKEHKLSQKVQFDELEKIGKFLLIPNEKRKIKALEALARLHDLYNLKISYK